MPRNADDGSSLFLESIVGEKTLLYNDGLYVGSVGFVEANSGGTFAVTTTAVPEPNSLLLLLCVSAIGCSRRRRCKVA